MNILRLEIFLDLIPARGGILSSVEGLGLRMEKFICFWAFVDSSSSWDSRKFKYSEILIWRNDLCRVFILSCKEMSAGEVIVEKMNWNFGTKTVRGLGIAGESLVIADLTQILGKINSIFEDCQLVDNDFGIKTEITKDADMAEGLGASGLRYRLWQGLVNFKLDIQRGIPAGTGEVDALEQACGKRSRGGRGGSLFPLSFTRYDSTPGSSGVGGAVLAVHDEATIKLLLGTKGYRGGRGGSPVPLVSSDPDSPAPYSANRVEVVNWTVGHSRWSGLTFDAAVAGGVALAARGHSCGRPVSNYRMMTGGETGRLADTFVEDVSLGALSSSSVGLGGIPDPIGVGNALLVAQVVEIIWLLTTLSWRLLGLDPDGGTAMSKSWDVKICVMAQCSRDMAPKPGAWFDETPIDNIQALLAAGRSLARQPSSYGRATPPLPNCGHD